MTTPPSGISTIARTIATHSPSAPQVPGKAQAAVGPSVSRIPRKAQAAVSSIDQVVPEIWAAVAGKREYTNETHSQESIPSALEALGIFPGGGGIEFNRMVLPVSSHPPSIHLPPWGRPAAPPPSIAPPAQAGIDSQLNDL